MIISSYSSNKYKMNSLTVDVFSLVFSLYCTFVCMCCPQQEDGGTAAPSAPTSAPAPAKPDLSRNSGSGPSGGGGGLMGEMSAILARRYIMHTLCVTGNSRRKLSLLLI